MEIQVAVLCDSASDFNGKLCLLGAFDTIIAPRLPAVHPQCSIALRLLFRKEEEGRHLVTLQFIDADGKVIVPPIETAVEVRLPFDSYFSSRNLVLNLQGLAFERAGQYSIEIAINGRQAAGIPLQVLVATAAEPAG